MPRVAIDQRSGGLVEWRKARSTGVRVELLDANDAPDFNPDEGGRWITLCCDHGNFVQHEQQHTAGSFMAAPEEWCEDCQAAMSTEGRGEWGHV